MARSLLDQCTQHPRTTILDVTADSDPAGRRRCSIRLLCLVCAATYTETRDDPDGAVFQRAAFLFGSCAILRPVRLIDG